MFCRSYDTFGKKRIFLTLTWFCLFPPGEGGGVKFHGVDLLQHSPSPSPSPGEVLPQQPHSLEIVTDTPYQKLRLRKTHSELDTTVTTGWWQRWKNLLPPLFLYLIFYSEDISGVCFVQYFQSEQSKKALIVAIIIFFLSAIRQICV